jgi:hypothetical protein
MLSDVTIISSIKTPPGLELEDKLLPDISHSPKSDMSLLLVEKDPTMNSSSKTASEPLRSPDVKLVPVIMCRNIKAPSSTDFRFMCGNARGVKSSLPSLELTSTSFELMLICESLLTNEVLNQEVKITNFNMCRNDCAENPYFSLIAYIRHDLEFVHQVDIQNRFEIPCLALEFPTLKAVFCFFYRPHSSPSS